MSRPGAPAPSLEDFVRHAERFGSEDVFDTAEQAGLPARELGYLARHLRRIDRRWRLTPGQRHSLIVSLTDAVVSDKDIRDMAVVAQSTLRRVREGLEPADPASPDRMDKGREVSKNGADKESSTQLDFDHFEGVEAV